LHPILGWLLPVSGCLLPVSSNLGKNLPCEGKILSRQQNFVFGKFFKFLPTPPLKLVERVAYPSPPAHHLQFFKHSPA
jgi:hypothetical protein